MYGDPNETFTRQFVPHEGGYIYYPSAESGGKLVTAAELAQLTEDWERIAGRAAIWKLAGLIVVAGLAWIVAADAMGVPHWARSAVFSIAIGSLMIVRPAWAESAPGRLVKGRPDIVPPRPRGEAEREERGMIEWPNLIIVLLFSGGVFALGLTVPPHSFAGWAGVIAFGLFFAACAWLAVRKLGDARGA